MNGEKTKCKSCFKGKSGEAIWCEHCGAGYVNGDKIKCKGCFNAQNGGAPCPEHKHEGHNHP